MWTIDATLLLPSICLSFTCVAGSEAAPKRSTRSYCRRKGGRSLSLGQGRHICRDSDTDLPHHIA
jgi:hypothetical protein